MMHVVLFFALATGIYDTLVFEDNFDEFNLSVWDHKITLSGGGNWEFQWYTNNRTNSFVRDGVLFLKPTMTADLIGEEALQSGYTMSIWGGDPASQCTENQWWGCERTSGAGGNILNPIQSAAVRTVNSFKGKYFKFEARAKMPKGDWIWPAIWLLPRYNSYGGWPSSGEIDIAESRGNGPAYPAGGNNQVGSALHWGPYWKENGYRLTLGTLKLPSGDFSSDWHVFGLVWNEEGIRTYIDDVNDPSKTIMNVAFDMPFWERGGWGDRFNNPWEGRSNSAPFDQEYYIIMNVAVGGTTGFWPDGAGKPWSNEDQHSVNTFYSARSTWKQTWQDDKVAMQIDWVRVWK
eukprot:gb/GEZN01008933.1/.p1 GENE.gb/GEZN01008933.1/~~gb/GEZN01008933.1/.p1  ORF type:complete len:347 (-),score=20.10 gb/GEZN01008933.1/:290-1330(-)